VTRFGRGPGTRPGARACSTRRASRRIQPCTSHRPSGGCIANRSRWGVADVVRGALSVRSWFGGPPPPDCPRNPVAESERASRESWRPERFGPVKRWGSRGLGRVGTRPDPVGGLEGGFVQANLGADATLGPLELRGASSERPGAYSEVRSDHSPALPGALATSNCHRDELEWEGWGAAAMARRCATFRREASHVPPSGAPDRAEELSSSPTPPLLGRFPKSRK
jgi:hypothetical protein